MNKKIIQNLKEYLETADTPTIQGIDFILKDVVDTSLIAMNADKGGDSVVLYVLCSLLIKQENKDA